jgi:hypothetical protein
MSKVEATNEEFPNSHKSLSTGLIFVEFSQKYYA